MSDKIIKLFATFFYAGYSPVAPGTAASLVGLFLAIALLNNPILYVIILGVVIVVGFAISGRIENVVKEKDPSCVVIDEVAGILIALFMLPNYSPPVLITAFFLFRAFDMFKIYPTNKLEELPGSVGIMTDDIVAGIYTNIVMQVAIRLSGLN